MNKRREDLRTKSNFLRRRRVAKAAEDIAHGVNGPRQGTKPRGIPNDAPAPPKDRGQV